MRPGEAVMELTRIGFHFRLDGEVVLVRFEGEPPKNQGAVDALLDTVRQHKDEVRHFLKSFCPTCGGMCFGTFAGVSRCMACYGNSLGI